jgi:hypothetical protein
MFSLFFLTFGGTKKLEKQSCGLRILGIYISRGSNGRKVEE